MGSLCRQVWGTGSGKSCVLLLVIEIFQEEFLIADLRLPSFMNFIVLPTVCPRVHSGRGRKVMVVDKLCPSHLYLTSLPNALFLPRFDSFYLIKLGHERIFYYSNVRSNIECSNGNSNNRINIIN